MAKPNPIRLQKFLGGMTYPASRDELIEHARSAGADDTTMEHLRALPDRRFDGPNEVSKSFSKET